MNALWRTHVRFNRPFHVIILLVAVIATLFVCATLAAIAFLKLAQIPKVLFRDDFSNSESGWDHGHYKDGVTDYIDNMYRIFVEADNLYFWANPGLSFANVRIEVEVTKAEHSKGGEFGIICRYQDVDNFYFFSFSTSGDYWISKKVKGEWSRLVIDPSDQKHPILPEDAPTRIRADCVGNDLTLFANGDFLAEAHDPDFRSGDVGLIVGTFDEPNADFLFDNFMVYAVSTTP